VYKGIEEKEKDIEFRKAREERNKSLPKDPTWRKNQKEGAKKACAEESWLEAHTGKNHWYFKGAVIGTDIETGEVKHRYIGGKEIKAAGHSYGAISQCINGHKTKYKGCTWHREPVEK